MKSKPVMILRNCLIAFMLVVVCMAAANPAETRVYAATDRSAPLFQGQLADDQPLTYPIMPMTAEQKRAEAELARSMPAAPIDQAIQRELQGRTDGAALSLLSRIQYTPSQRNQGNAGNCWVWASTGILEVALNVQQSIKERLSIQYFDSNYTPWAGCGGNAQRFSTFYASKLKVIPWSNTNASYQDAGRTCESGSSLVAPGSIGQTPSYAITSIGPVQQIPTFGVGQATAINNIKNILGQNKAIYFAFGLANQADWNQFFTFWYSQAESVIWPYGFSCGDVWNDDEGAFHAVLCVGYDDSAAGTANDYWIMLNSWGSTAGRPNGLFRIPMYYDYNCGDSTGDPNTYWYSIPVTFSAACTKPGAPTLHLPVNGATISGASATFTWSAGTGSPTKYWLQVNTNSTFTGTNKYYAQVNGTSQPVSGLPANGSTIYWRVQAGNACGWGTWSLTRNFVNSAACTRPGAPTLNLPANAGTVSGTSGTFTWAAGTGSPTKYWLEINSSSTFVGGTRYYYADVGAVVSKTVTTLPASGSTLYWRVQPYNACGWGTWSLSRNFVNGP